MKPEEKRDMKCTVPGTAESRSGAALLIVLGFLAILTIIIIAFTTQSRMERLSGRAYLVNAQTRQLLHVALTRALEDLESSSGSS